MKVRKEWGIGRGTERNGESKEGWRAKNCISGEGTRARMNISLPEDTGQSQLNLAEK